jgi:hypothetical protein
MRRQCRRGNVVHWLQNEALRGPSDNDMVGMTSLTIWSGGGDNNAR